MGIGFSGGVEGKVKVIRADQIKPRRFAQAIGTAIFRPNGFVNYVPTVDLASIMAGNGVDVLSKMGAGIGLVHCGLEPGRQLLMPAEIVAAHLLIGKSGKAHELIRLREVENAGGGS